MFDKIKIHEHMCSEGRIHPPSKRSFSAPGGVYRGLDSQHRAKIGARELASVASRGFPWHPAFQLPKLEIQNWSAAAATF